MGHLSTKVARRAGYLTNFFQCMGGYGGGGVLAAGIDSHIIFRFWKNGLFCLVHARLFLPLNV